LNRDISDFKKGYRPRNLTVKDEKCDLVTDSHITLTRWSKHFSQLLNLHGVNDVRQTEIHTAGSLVPKPNAFEVEMAIEKLKRHKSPGTDQIPAEFINSLRTINLLVLFGIRSNCLSSGKSRSLYLFIRRVMTKIVVIIET